MKRILLITVILASAVFCGCSKTETTVDNDPVVIDNTTTTEQEETVEQVTEETEEDTDETPEYKDILGGVTYEEADVEEAPTEPEVEAPTEPKVEAPTEPEVVTPAEPEVEAPTEPEVNITEETKAEPEKIGVTDIKLSMYSVSLKVGEKKMPIVTMSPQNAADKSEKWTSSNESVATVDSLGNIKGIAEGECTVTVTSVDNPEVSAVVNVTVTVPVEVGCTYIDGILIVNKTYPLPKDYAPGWETEATPYLWKMIAAAENDGIKLWMKSGYRSYSDQEYIYNRYVARDGQAEADRYSARPGHSEHQTGLAFDLNSTENSFADTPEAKWIEENCYKYGFILRYPRDKEEITGYIYEPWHVRYVGVEKAAEIYESGLCLEEFLNITSAYQ